MTFRQHIPIRGVCLCGWLLEQAAGGARRDSRGLWLFREQAVHHVSAQVLGAIGLLPASTLNVKKMGTAQIAKMTELAQKPNLIDCVKNYLV